MVRSLAESFMARSGKKPQTAAVAQRRFLLRYPTNAGALVIRDTDPMRCGIEATLKNVSLAGLGIQLGEPLALNEQVVVRVRNEIQRVEKEVRGVVRHATLGDDGQWYVGLELYSRLTPLEVGLLRMGLLRDSGEDAMWM